MDKPTLREKIDNVLDSIEKVANTGVKLPRNHYRIQILNLVDEELEGLTVIGGEYIASRALDYGITFVKGGQAYLFVKAIIQEQLSHTVKELKAKLV